MIPSTTGFLDQDFKIEEQPGKSYKMERDKQIVRGYCDGLEAMKQAVFKILNTERFQYPIYSWNYGIETIDLYGEPVSYVCPELENRIKDALLVDSRILSVTDFAYDTDGKGAVHTTFTVHTIYGDLETGKEVTI